MYKVTFHQAISSIISAINIHRIKNSEKIQEQLQLVKDSEYYLQKKSIFIRNRTNIIESELL